MKRILPILTLSILTLISCSDKSSDKQTVEIPTTAVVTKTAQKINHQQIIQTSGKVTAMQSANISTRIMGNVKSVAVKVGDKVAKGQLLLNLDDTDLQAKLLQTESGISQAQANLKNVETNYNRIKNLFESNSASQKELDDITTHYNVAKAQLEMAKQNKKQVLSQLNYTKIKAPFNGVITGKFIKEGDIANPGMPLLVVEDKNQLEVITTIAESDITAISKDNNVTVFVPTLNATFEGKVKELSSSAKLSGAQYMATISVNETNDQLLPGMFARVSFYADGESGNSSIYIDQQALVKKGQLTGVYTVSHKNTAILRWIQTGAEKEGLVEVISGVDEGDQYIISSDSKLFNGIQITSK